MKCLKNTSENCWIFFFFYAYIYPFEIYSQFTLLWNDMAGRAGGKGGRMVTSVKLWLISFFPKHWQSASVFEIMTYIIWNCDISTIELTFEIVTYLFPQHWQLTSLSKISFSHFPFLWNMQTPIYLRCFVQLWSCKGFIQVADVTMIRLKYEADVRATEW